MCEKRGRAGGTVECEESVCCDQDGFGCMSLAQFMSRCVAFSGFTKRP